MRVISHAYYFRAKGRHIPRFSSERRESFAPLQNNDLRDPR